MIKQQLQKDQIAALKSGDKERLGVLRYILAYLKNLELDKKEDLTEEEVVKALRKQGKEVQESIDAFEKGRRDELVEENKKKLDIISSYLPAEMPDNELKNEIQKIIDANKQTFETKPKAVIGLCVQELRTKVDPARVSKMLKEEFGV